MGQMRHSISLELQEKEKTLEKLHDQVISTEKEINALAYEKKVVEGSLKGYDGRIKVTTLEDLAKKEDLVESGWHVEVSDPELYEKRSEQNTIVVSVIGNYNKGKTWLLSKLCELNNIPFGFSVTTEGISFVYTQSPESGRCPTLAIDT